MFTLLRRHLRLVKLVGIIVSLLNCAFVVFYVNRPQPPTSWHQKQRHIREFMPRKGAEFLASPRGPCPSFLAVLVTSRAEHVLKRKAARDSWAQDADGNETRVYFVLGKQPDNTSLQDIVRSEIATYADIIQADFVDTRRNGTLKTVFLLQWVVTTCPRVHFVMKATDYAFVNVPNLHRYLQMREDEERGPFVAGSVVMKRPVQGDPLAPGDLPPVIYQKPTFPPFLEGFAYVMPGEAVEVILNKALDTPFLYLEDVFVTGVVAGEGLQVPLVNSECFQSCATPTPPCAHHWFLAVCSNDTTQWGTLRVESRRICTEHDVNLHC